MSELKITKKRVRVPRPESNTSLANKPTMLLVLGMHRSGTSVTTRLLECLGAVNSLNLMPPVPGINEKGFFEDFDICQFNENTLLPRLGISWYSVGFVDWSRISTTDRSKLALEALEIVRKNYNNANSLSILKEPRIGILLPFWLSVLRHAGFNCKVVCAVRDPLSVSRSLQKRDGFSPAHAGMLYATNWLSILNYIQELPVAFVDFDEVFLDPSKVLKQVAEKLAITLPKDLEVRAHEFATQFIDPSLRHSRIESQDLALAADLPPLAIEAYEHLLTAAQFQNIKKTGKFVPNSEKRIASIKPLLGDFDRLIHRLHIESKRYADLQKNYEATKSIAEQSAAQIQATQDHAQQLIQREALLRGEVAERLTRLEQEKAGLQASLAETQARHHALTAELEHEKTQAASSHSLAAQTSAERNSLQEQLANSQQQLSQTQQHIQQLEAANGQANHELGELAERLTRLEQEKAGLQASLAETQARHHALTAELEQEKSRAITAQRIATETTADLNILQKHFAASQEQISQAQERIQQLEAANGQAHHELGELADHLTRLKQEKTDNEKAIADSQQSHHELLDENLRIKTVQTELEANIRERFEELAKMATMIIERDTDLATTRLEIEQSKQAILQLQQETKNLHHEGTQQQETINELTQQKNTLTELIHQRDEEYANLKSNLEQRFRELAKLSKMYLASKEHCEAAVADNIKLKKTISWRITAPLRLTNLLLKKLSKQERVLRKQRKIIIKSGLFDEEFYSQTYPDVVARKMDPISHYLLFGAKEGRNPSPSFNTDRYLDRYPDVRKDRKKINPLIHYALYGKKENRNFY